MSDDENSRPEGPPTRTLADRYVLESLIGRGGMGTVYSAWDEWERRKVAVKLIKNRRASGGRAWRMFSRELRAVLKLDHPGIVSVYDYGVDDDGLPFFVMEFVPGLSLGELAHDQLRWMDLVDIFEQMLETLAYAHARGIIHRDIKPDNFLIAPGDGRPRLKLVDFGIAKLLGKGSMERRSPETAAETLTDLARDFTLSGDSTVGTPAYMAPELGLNEVHLIGPQTDLYSLGCMLFEFISGHRPYDGRNIISLILAHCSAPIPALHRRDGEPVPSQLERLIQRLLEKNPRRRAWCAMDVLEQLHRVPDFELDTESSLEPWESRVLPQLLDQTGESIEGAEATGPNGAIAEPMAEPRADAETVAMEPPDETVADDSVQPTVPVYRDSTGETEQSGEFEAPLYVTRLGVAALREPKIVGRASEQSWLMDHTREVLRSGVPRLLVLRGARGMGRSRLARWVSEQFVERGACRVLRLTYREDISQIDGLRDAIREALGIGPDDEAIDLLGSYPGGEDLTSLEVAARYLEGDDVVGGAGRVPVGLITGLLDMVRRDKPLMLVVENLEPSLEYGLPDLILSALQRGSDWPWPMLAVATLRDSTDADGDSVGELLDHERCFVADLGPVSVAEGRELLQSLLPLRDAAADRISEYAGGSPDVMLQMLRALAAAGDVYASGGQYWVKPEAWDDLTHVDDVYAVGVDRLMDGLAEGRGELVLIASLMGMEPDIEVLEAIVEQLGYDRDVRSEVDELLDEGIWVGTEEGGIRFAHALMHEAWQARASRASEYRSWQQAIGRELERRAAARGRVGLHLYESGDEDAFEFLLAGAEDALEQGEYALAAKYLSAARATTDTSHLAPESQVALAAGLGRLAMRRSNEEFYRAAVDALTEVDGTLAAGWRAWIEGAWAARSGRLDEARSKLAEAVAAFEELDSTADVLRARESLADALRKSGDYRGAEQEAEHALSLAASIDNQRSMARLLDLLGFVCLETERYEDAAAYAGRARELGVDNRDRSEVARALKIECGALMRLGRLDEAFERGKEALTIFREVGDSVGELSMLNLLGMLRHEAGAFGQARQYALEALERSEQIGEQALRGRILNNLGHACEELGRPDEARQAYVRGLWWSHDSSDLQNEARVCFNLARLVRTSRPNWSIVLAERSRRILETLGLPYLRESERVLDELADSIGRERLEHVLSTYEDRLEQIRATGGAAGP